MRKIVFIMLICIIFAGCNSLKDFKKELEQGGFSLWYPAESGVEPGQIWITNGRKKHIQQRRPSNLELFGPNRVKFRTLTKKVNADMSLDAAFAQELLGGADELSVLFKNATVKSIELDFGETTVSRIVLGDLADPNVTKNLSQGYLNDLEKVRTRPEYVLIAAIVTSSGMKYTFECEDTKQLEAKVPEISKLIQGEFKLNISSGTTANWEIPETDVLAIGTTLVSGQDMRSRTGESAEARALDVQNSLLKLKKIPLEKLLESDR